MVLGFSSFLAYSKLLLFTGYEIVIGLLVNRTDGIGLSAPQVGINVHLMVFNPVGERGEGEEIVLVNPKVSRFSRKIVPFNEGCLSFPGIYADVEVYIQIFCFHIEAMASFANFLVLMLLYIFCRDQIP